jgi:mRNA-degrading endonuclease toxin of MazEF toxin-antitoxin module
MKFEKWSVWLANLDPVIGSEQGKTRPVIIVSENQINEVLSVVNVPQAGDLETVGAPLAGAPLAQSYK